MRCVILFVILLPCVSAMDWYVAANSTAIDPDGTSWATAFTCVTQGVAKANEFANSTLYIGPGIYFTLCDTNLDLSAPMSIIGAGEDNTILRDSRSSTFTIRFASIVSISSLTIRSSDADEHGGAITVEQGTLTMTSVAIEDCVAKANYAVGGAIALSKGASLFCTLCTFTRNFASSGAAISAQSASVALKDCYLQDNIQMSQGLGSAVFLRDGSLTVHHSVILSSSRGTLVDVVTSQPVRFTDSFIVVYTHISSPDGWLTVANSPDVRIHNTSLNAWNGSMVVGVDAYQSEVTLSYVTIADSSPANTGSLFRAVGSSLHLHDVVVEGLVHSDDLSFVGLCLVASDRSNVTIRRGSWSNVTTALSCFSVYGQSTLDVRATTFQDWSLGTAVGDSVIALITDASIILKDVLILNSIGSGTPVFSLVGASAVMSDVEYHYSSTPFLWMMGSSTLTMRGGGLSNNIVDDRGQSIALIDISDGYAWIIDGAFNNNVFPVNIHVTENAEVWIDRCDFGFLSTEPPPPGAGIPLATILIEAGATAHFSGLTTFGNVTTRYGDVLGYDQATVIFNDTAILSAQAVLVYDAFLLFENSYMRGSVAPYRAPIRVEGNANALIRDSEFTENTGVAGGVIYMGNDAGATITRNTFNVNTALFGGAICADDTSRPIIENNTFQENSAQYYGGSLWLVNSGAVRIVHLNHFISNTADIGGAIYADGTCLYILNSVFSGNTAEWGNNTAGSPISLAIVSLQEIIVSGQLMDPIILAARDIYNNTIGGMGITVLIRAVSPSGYPIVYTGPNLRSADAGLISFDLVTIVGPVGGSVTFQFVMQLSNEQVAVSRTVNIAPCGPGQMAVEDVCQPCARDTYGYDGQSCVACPIDALCPGGGAVLAVEGYWVYAPEFAPVQFFTCAPGYCLGNNTCREHQSGTLCSVCDPGYYDFGTGCLLAEGLDPWAATFNIIVCLVVVLWYTRPIDVNDLEPAATPAIIITFYQTLTILSALKVELQILKPLVGKLGITLSQHAPAPLDVFGQFYVQLALPLVFVILLCLIAIVRMLVGCCVPGIGMSRVNFAQATVNLCLVAFSPFAVAVVSMFYCEDLGHMHVLSANVGQECSGAEYERALIAGASLTVLIIGVLPPVLLHMLGRLRRAKRNDTLALFLPLYINFRETEWFWQFVVLYRQICIVAVISLPSSMPWRLFLVEIIVLLSLGLQRLFSPYKIDRDNQLETTSLLLLLLFLMALDSTYFTQIASVRAINGVAITCAVVFFLRLLPEVPTAFRAGVTKLRSVMREIRTSARCQQGCCWCCCGWCCRTREDQERLQPWGPR